MVITKDYDWMSAVSEVCIYDILEFIQLLIIFDYWLMKDVAFPKVEELCARVLASHIICEDDGLLCFLSNGFLILLIPCRCYHAQEEVSGFKHRQLISCFDE